MSKTFKAAVIQQAIADNNKAKNFAATAAHIETAVAEGVELVVLQELHASQYFCQVEQVSCFDLAEPLDGETFQFFADIAAQHDIVIVMSGFEKRAPGLYHNTAQVIDGMRGRAGIFRKMHIPDDPGFYEKFYFTPGDADTEKNKGFLPIETRLGKLGVLVCWDQWYPEAARLMALAGAEMLIYPTAIGWDRADSLDEQLRQKNAWQLIQRAHAVANGLPVLVANRTGFEASPVDDGSGIDFWGGSFICGPQGELLAEATAEDEYVLMAEVDRERSESVRRIWPYFRDRRIDAYGDIDKRWLEKHYCVEKPS